MTNYFHYISAGNFAYYLEKYVNLYMYTQQDWEQVYDKAKQAYNHNTQKEGGHGGSSKLLTDFFLFVVNYFGILDMATNC